VKIEQLLEVKAHSNSILYKICALVKETVDYTSAKIKFTPPWRY